MRHCILNDCGEGLCCFDCEYMRECSSRCIRKSPNGCMRLRDDTTRIFTEISGREERGSGD